MSRRRHLQVTWATGMYVRAALPTRRETYKGVPREEGLWVILGGLVSCLVKALGKVPARGSQT